MTLVALLLMQGAAVPDVAFDLRELPARAPDCDATTGDEIVVCGRSDSLKHRLPPLAPTPVEPLLPRAEFKLFGDVKGAIENEAVQMPGGVQSNRIMLRMKVPF